MKAIFKKALIDTIPVMTGYLVLGMGFGILMQAKGYGLIWSLAMSLFIYAGSMQYAAVGLISGSANLLTVALTTLMVNARHIFYGIAMVDKYKGMGIFKPYLIFSLTDETYSLVCNGAEDRRYYAFVSLLDHFYWVTGTVLGALVGSFLKFNTDGIDFALTALFLTVFTDQWLNTKKHLSAIIGLVSSVLCLLTFGQDTFLIPAMILIALSLIIMRKYE